MASESRPNSSGPRSPPRPLFINVPNRPVICGPAPVGGKWHRRPSLARSQGAITKAPRRELDARRPAVGIARGEGRYRPRGLPCRHWKMAGMLGIGGNSVHAAFQLGQHNRSAAQSGFLWPGQVLPARIRRQGGQQPAQPTIPVTHQLGAAPGDAAQRPSLRRAAQDGRAGRRRLQGIKPGLSGRSSDRPRATTSGRGPICSLSTQVAAAAQATTPKAIRETPRNLQGLGADRAVSPAHDRSHQAGPHLLAWQLSHRSNHPSGPRAQGRRAH